MFSDRSSACQFRMPSFWSCVGGGIGFNPLLNNGDSDEDLVFRDTMLYLEGEASTLTKDQESLTTNNSLFGSLHWMMMKESNNKQERMMRNNNNNNNNHNNSMSSLPPSPSKSEATATTHSSSTETLMHHPSCMTSRRRAASAPSHDKSPHLSFATYPFCSQGRRDGDPQASASSRSCHRHPCQDEVSVLSFTHHADDEGEDDLQPLIHSSSEMVQHLEYWRNRASERFRKHGIQDPRTAEALVELGMAHVQCQQIKAGQDFFRTAFRVLEKQYGPHDLRLAMALERAGIAMSSHVAGYQLALLNLQRSFVIRYHRLGPDHIDTVESVNKIGTMHMKLQCYAQAKQDFLEVLTLRSAIFGHRHPSVAISAQALGTVHLMLGEIEQAKAYFLQALDIFYHHGLGRNPAAQKLRRDLHSMGYDDRMEI